MSHPWHDLATCPTGNPSLLAAVIENPKGSKVKSWLDKTTGLLPVDRILHSPVLYPAHYGFILRTFCLDDDPRDTM